ncbi:sigma-54 interaction domain-containing protein [Desulfosporosinus nitroreducens]|uniref:Sigma 54-interacting transcriptional regulator n=1 Tax=Desulfosporosinus nitroreducens TaxID=2018668 RepID=A0ABT8QL93_9FIRM|nr:sigma 54-interacting transcriptional regulator [Desulfosporosinus nitroreducens]MCO1604365.1 sigma 54-interacting transcriptional regulator [Desulfosporosinus nitroreducens]MDO0822112.1 sigma 54-interacting transcriptional regulator [Desulfosporosinus nitroreducens]
MDKKVYFKIEELQKENENLKKENELLRTVIDSVHESVYVVNEIDEIILYNTESEKMEGLDRKDILGKKEEDVFAQPYYFSEEVTKKILKTGKPLIEQPYWYNLNCGRKTNMIFSAYPFYYKGQIIAVYVIFRNMNQMSDFIAITLEMHKKFIKQETNHHDGAMFLLDDIIGITSKMKKITTEARRIAFRKSPVLIVGETGTGKELFAQGIHNASLYSKGPFIPVNCAAIPDTLLESLLFGTVKGAFTGAIDTPGLFEQAEDGTIFLDEINSMSFSLQAKLLRVLQDKSVRRLGSKVQIPLNCRVISATNMDPIEAVKKQVIRSDLYFRLATITLNIPPLRERKEDIEVLARHFIRKCNTEFGLFINDISEELINFFERYDWPGNVRELENFIEGAMNFVLNKDKILKLHHLPEYFGERLFLLKDTQNHKDSQSTVIDNRTLQSALLETEKSIIESTLMRNKGNISRSAQVLGISRQNLHYKLKALGITNK